MSKVEILIHIVLSVVTSGLWLIVVAARLLLRGLMAPSKKKVEDDVIRKKNLYR